MAGRLVLSRKSTGMLPNALHHLPYHVFYSTFCKRIERLPFTMPVLRPPVAKKVTHTTTAHGVSWLDPYHWMRDVSDPDFLRYIDEENVYFNAFMRDTEEMQKTLYSEMVSRMPSRVTTPPERWGSWFYYQYIPEGKEYPVLCRESALETGVLGLDMFNAYRGWRGQILLDWNEIAEQKGYVHVGTCRISPDHNFLAYTLDTTGHEHFQLQVKDIRSDAILPQHSVDGVMSLAWAQDSNTLFYTLCDGNQRPYRVLCTTLGLGSKDDTVVITENDSRFCVDISSTKDGKFVTVNSNSRTSSEVHVINATHPQAGLQRFCKRTDGVQFFLEHHGSTFYVLTNAPISNNDKPSVSGYHLARCRDADIDSMNLKSVIMSGEDYWFEDMDIFNEHLVLWLVKGGSSAVCSIGLPIPPNDKEMKIEDLKPWYFPIPSKMCSITPGSNHDFLSTTYRAILSSPAMPDLLVDYDMLKKTFSIVHQEDVRNISMSYKEIHTDSSKTWQWEDCSECYACEEKEVLSHDGLKIPLTILFSRKAYKKGKSPGLLHGYGAYGEPLDKSWCANRLSLLDRGWMFAFADVRGGAGIKPSWHSSGRGLSKLNSIHDFIACGEYLVNEGFIHRHHLAAVGISAGSLLVGAAVTMRPELFNSVILKVPFLDILNTLLDPTLPLTILDYEEFGNPQTKAFFDYILKYSPYDNIPPGACLPSMLVSAAFNDSRVGVWEAAKWVAKIRDTACSSCSSVILHTSKEGGHFREGGRFAECQEMALEYAFLMKVSGTI